MKIIGLTGGIGSGKSTIAKEFAARGIPVYNSDDEAKKLIPMLSCASALQKPLAKTLMSMGNTTKPISHKSSSMMPIN